MSPPLVIVPIKKVLCCDAVDQACIDLLKNFHIEVITFRFLNFFSRIMIYNENGSIRNSFR